jgi:hypothetical protein
MGAKMSYIGWVTMPSPYASDVGPRVLWMKYVNDSSVRSKIRELAEKHLQQMQLKCDKCYTAYSLEDIACGAEDGHGCGKNTLSIVHKTVDNEMVGRIRIKCQNNSCRREYSPPRERVATCKQHPDNSLSYLLNGNEQSALLPIMCMAVADPEIRSTTEYFQAATSSNSAGQALRWLEAQNYVRKRRIGVHTKNIHDPYVYVTTPKGNEWFNSQLEIFEAHGLKDSFVAFVKDRISQLEKIQVPEQFGLENFVKYCIKVDEIPQNIKHSIMAHAIPNEEFGKRIISMAFRDTLTSYLKSVLEQEPYSINLGDVLSHVTIKQIPEDVKDELKQTVGVAGDHYVTALKKAAVMVKTPKIVDEFIESLVDAEFKNYLKIARGMDFSELSYDVKRHIADASGMPYRGFRKELLEGLELNDLSEGVMKWLKLENEKYEKEELKFISSTKGAIWVYVLPIPVKKNKKDIAVRHVPTPFIEAVISNDKRF